MVFLFGLMPGTGRHAPLNLKLDAGPVGGPVDVDRARGKREHVFDDFQGLSQRICRCIWAVVKSPILLHAAHDRESRKILFDGESHIGILFVVPQHNIEARFVAFD